MAAVNQLSTALKGCLSVDFVSGVCLGTNVGLQGQTCCLQLFSAMLLLHRQLQEHARMTLCLIIDCNAVLQWLRSNNRGYAST
jgi:hypothetical protein